MTNDVFDPDWLSLREPVDHQSRALALLPILEATWKRLGWSRVLDLAAGTGSNLRYLAPRLPEKQVWTLVDHDADLLKRADSVKSVSGLKKVHGDIGREGLAAVKHAELVTGSALLDLVSEEWLRALVSACESSTCGALFTLTYDGAINWKIQGAPSDPCDEMVRSAVNTHQQGDKGLGPALGSTACSVAEQIFRNAGYRTWCEPSPWNLSTVHSELALNLVEGWAAAAIQVKPQDVASIQAWARRRSHVIMAGNYVLTVGHLDFLALPNNVF